MSNPLSIRKFPFLVSLITILLSGCVFRSLQVKPDTLNDLPQAERLKVRVKCESRDTIIAWIESEELRNFLPAHFHLKDSDGQILKVRAWAYDQMGDYDLRVASVLGHRWNPKVGYGGSFYAGPNHPALVNIQFESAKSDHFDFVILSSEDTHKVYSGHCSYN